METPTRDPATAAVEASATPLSGVFPGWSWGVELYIILYIIRRCAMDPPLCGVRRSEQHRTPPLPAVDSIQLPPMRSKPLQQSSLAPTGQLLGWGILGLCLLGQIGRAKCGARVEHSPGSRSRAAQYGGWCNGRQLACRCHWRQKLLYEAWTRPALHAPSATQVAIQESQTPCTAIAARCGLAFTISRTIPG